VVVSNHISHFDPVFLSIAFARPIDWMTTEEFYGNAFLGAWLRALNTFPVDRSRPDRRAVRLGVERLRTGRWIGIFPEGGIRAGPTSIIGGATPKSGATALARLGAVPIIPCLIFGSDRLYHWKNWIPIGRRIPVWIAVGRAFTVPDDDEATANARLAASLRQLAQEGVARFALSPDDLPATPQHRKGRDAVA
jgi:1-acyl-sn-glycerol-3-phosphate acyltransferase